MMHQRAELSALRKNEITLVPRFVCEACEVPITVNLVNEILKTFISKMCQDFGWLQSNEPDCVSIKRCLI